MPINVINPATGKLRKSYPLMKQQEVNDILNIMEIVRQDWEKTSFETRSQLMRTAAKELRQNNSEYALIITEEMGKPISQSLTEIEKCAVLCEFYAENAEKFLQPTEIKTGYRKSYRCFKPLGIIYAIMPWNFPFWQVLRFAVPNLMGGNAGVLSHAPNSTGAALAIERIFEKAGFPKGLFRILVIDIDLSPFVTQHPNVRGVTLTGSDNAGRAVGAEASKALKKVVLELGGSDPYLVLEDANLENAAEQCIISRLTNAGQICISAKRIIVVDAVREQFQRLILKKAEAYVAGDPLQQQTMLGPMAREDLRQKLHDQVQRCIKAGSRLMMGGKLPAGNGFYYPTTVLFDVTADSPAFREELFGPVVCIVPARNEAHAIKLANDTVYGLAAAVFTENLQKGEDIAARLIQAGTCNVNGLVKSDPSLPFGGIKQSGFGRELSSEGIHEFMNIKTVNIH